MESKVIAMNEAPGLTRVRTPMLLTIIPSLPSQWLVTCRTHCEIELALRGVAED